jgi:hypothetical protein
MAQENSCLTIIFRAATRHFREAYREHVGSGSTDDPTLQVARDAGDCGLNLPNSGGNRCAEPTLRLCFTRIAGHDEPGHLIGLSG